MILEGHLSESLHTCTNRTAPLLYSSKSFEHTVVRYIEAPDISVLGGCSQCRLLAEVAGTLGRRGFKSYAGLLVGLAIL